jgi:hypothetical protein
MYSSGCRRLNTSALSPGVVVVDGPAWFSTGAVVIVLVRCIAGMEQS